MLTKLVKILSQQESILWQESGYKRNLS